jgi:hypothetical protein
MNCQKGDLARVIPPGVKAECDCGCGWRKGLLIDKIVRLGELVGEQRWVIEERVPVKIFSPCGTSAMGFLTAISDEILRPIRNPGPEATDETIQRLGTPMDMRLRMRLENELAKMNDSLDQLEKVLTR